MPTIFISLIGLLVLVTGDPASAYQNIIQLKVSTANQKSRQDLAAVFFQTNRNIKEVKKNADGSIQVEFIKTEGYLYQAALLALQHNDPFSVIRDQWQQNYMSHPDQVKLSFQMPKTLAEFEKLTNYPTWSFETIQSELKDRPRKVFRHKNFHGHIFRVSEISLNKDESQQQPAKEVEIAISFEKNYVFFVFDEHGKLTSEAQFPDRKLKAPLSCNGCHYDIKTGTIGRFFKKL